MGLKIGWGKFDVNAKGNSTPTIEDKQDFSNLEQLKLDDDLVNPINYATVGELNQTILDDSQPIIPVNPNPDNIILWSKSLSDSMGYFENNPILNITFSDVVTSTGITLYFLESSNDYCREIIIRWYDFDDVLQSEMIFYPDNWKYKCSNYIEQYKRLEIEFVRTSLPYRFVKMSNILYGENVLLTDKNVISASLIESIGLTSSQIFTNQFECDIISLVRDFNIITNPGEYLGLQINQQLEVKTSEDKEYGKYFIQKSVVNGNIISLVANDLIGYLETQEFKGGLYEDVTFEFILNQIKTQANLLNVFGGEHSGFIVPTEISNRVMSGYIPFTNCREALHQLCYAANVVANCKRNSKIEIFELSNLIAYDTLDESKIILDTLSVEENELYTGVALNAFSYKISNENKELENKEYEVGTHTITFTSPYRNITVSGATLIESGNNYVIFEVITAGTIVINGYAYEEVKQRFVANNESYTGSTPSIKEMSDVRMVNPLIAQSVAENQLKLYKFKYKVSSDIWNLQANIGEFVSIENAEGYIQQIETDLIAEDVCSVEVLGNAKVNN